MPTYTIGEAARRSGFSPATLRYYDDLGLVRPAERSPAGYRRYDERDIERLRFVEHTKQLGCSLEEVADLLVAWDGGECGPVQDRLRGVVAAKVDEARMRLRDLRTLLGDLERAALALERHRPVGACDALCGCAPDASVGGNRGPVAAPVGFGRLAPPDTGPALACSLDPDQLAGRVDEWRAVASAAVERTSIDGGVRLSFGPPPVAAVDLGRLAALVADEHACCPFWGFEITVGAGDVVLEVRGPADALTLLDELLGMSA